MSSNKFLFSAIASLMFVASCSCMADPSVTPFTFLRITDTHIGDNGSHVPEDTDEVTAINQFSPAPDFVINCGDLVDEGRIIDLSFGAAQKLSMVEAGLASVKLEVISRGKSHRHRADPS